MKIRNDGDPIEIDDIGITIESGITENAEISEEILEYINAGKLVLLNNSDVPVETENLEVDSHVHSWNEITDKPTFGTSKLFHVQDRKDEWTHGGTFSSGARRVRDLNTVVRNEIAGASLTDADTILLPPGIYDVNILAPANYVRQAKAWLWSITEQRDLLIGLSCSVYQSRETSYCPVTGRIELSDKYKEHELEIHHQCNRSISSYGFGYYTGFDIEIYTDVQMRKL